MGSGGRSPMTHERCLIRRGWAGDQEDHAQDEVREVLVAQDEELGALQGLRVGCREEEEGPHHPRQINCMLLGTY